MLAWTFGTILACAGVALGAAGVVDPSDLGAVGDGKADDTAAIQAALDQAAQGARVVILRPGAYRITATLNVPDGVSLSGALARWEDGSTTIVVEQNGFSAVRLNNASNVRALQFSYPNNQKGDSPDEYPPTILLAGINPSVESVRFDSAWIGIAPPPEGANTGQCLLRDITGFTHKVGIRLDGIKDIARIEDVHWFVPGYDASFARRERVGFEFGNVDGVIMSGCFLIGGKTFVHQLPTDGGGDRVHSLGLHITQCWTESVRYGFLIEGTCGFILSDTQIYVSDPEGVGILMRMPHLYYHSVISNTQVRLVGGLDHATGIEYSPSDDHPLNHLMVHHCQVQEGSVGVRLGPNAKRVFVSENHILAHETGVQIEEGATQFMVKDNMIAAPTPVAAPDGEAAQGRVEGNLAL